MRLLLALVCVLLVGCAGPHSTGALWAQQNLDRELVMYGTSDTQRTDQAQAFKLGLADQTLAAERSRMVAALQDCPGSPRQPLGVSTGDRVRDAIRVRAQGDTARLATVAQVALADWRLRRARSTGEARFCDDARQALSGSAIEPSTSDVLENLGTATVTRDRRHSAPALETWSRDVTLSNYVLGYVETVQAPSPLPQYLAAVYGGVLVSTPPAPALNGITPEATVDRLAPAYPEWEPDALYAAFATP